MSKRTKNQSRRVLMPAALLGTLVMTGLGITSIAAGQRASTQIQNNVGISTSQPSCDNALDYFILQSQQDFIDAINNGQAEEVYAKIG